MPYQMTFEGRTVLLIDTPGFNDSSVRDVDILNDLAGWLAKSYEASVRLHGLIYLHGIQDARMTGSDRMHLNVFKKMTGLENMTQVVLATSFWDVTDHSKGEYREKQLSERNDFWKDMKDAGAAMIRFKNDRASAMDMVKHIVDHNKKTTLKIQVEMQEGKTVRNTGAGQTLEEDISGRVKNAEKEFEKKNDDLRQAMKDENEQAAQEALNAQEKLKKEMAELNKTKEKLDVTTKELIAQKDAEIKRFQDETENLKKESQKAGEEHRRQLSEKDKEKAAAMEQVAEEVDRQWQQGIQQGIQMYKDQMGEFAQGMAANVGGGAQQPAQGQRPALTEERVQEMWERREREQRNQQLEADLLKAQADLAKAQAPPPYSMAGGGPSQYRPPPQNYPQPIIYSQPSHNHDAALGAAIGGMSILGLMGCTVM